MTGRIPKRKPSREELIRLVGAFRETGDPGLQETLVRAYTPLVETLARKFVRGRISYEDVFQVGMLGLLASLRRFDPALGRTFESFAVPTIVGEIKRYIRDKTWSVHVPRRIKELSPKIKRIADELTARLQRSPQIAEIAEALGISEEDVLETLEMGRSYYSLSIDSELESDSDGNAVSLLDMVGVEEEGYNRIDRQLMLDRALHALDQREQAIIHLTFFRNLSQKQAGDLLGMSQMHVSRLQRRALGKLRAALQADNPTS